MRIAFVGPNWGTSRQRADALSRLGHTVSVVDPWSWLPKSRWTGRWLHYAGGFGFDVALTGRIYRKVTETKPEFIFVNQGEFIGPGILRKFREFRVPIVNYANDNPFSKKSEARFRNYRKALALYDLVVVTFAENVDQAHRAGARNIKRVYLCADEVTHAQRQLTADEQLQFGSDVGFIAQWAPERGPFMARLIELGIPLSIWGDRWEKAAEWAALKPHWRGPGMFNGNFAKVIQSAKISLCLLSKTNGNLHTGRSITIPVLGSVLCAERSSEHQELYYEGTEAVFWSDAKECAAVCKALLTNEPRRLAIAQRGHERAFRNNHFNEPVMASIIEAAIKSV